MDRWASGASEGDAPFSFFAAAAAAFFGGGGMLVVPDSSVWVFLTAFAAAFFFGIAAVFSGCSLSVAALFAPFDSSATSTFRGGTSFPAAIASARAFSHVDALSLASTQKQAPG